MEFVFEVDTVQEAISLVFDLAPSKSTNGRPVPVKIQSFEDTNMVELSVSESDCVVSYKIVADVRSSGECIVDLSSLYKAITGFVTRIGNSNGTDVIKFGLGRQTLTLTAKAYYGGKLANQRRTLSILDYTMPAIIPPNNEYFVSLPCALVTSALRKVIFSLPSGSEPGSLNGVLFYINAEVFKVVSTNGVTLTEFKHCIQGNKGQHDCLLGSTFISKLTRTLSKISPEVEGEPDIQFCVGKNVFWFRYKGLIVGSPLLNTAFPDYSLVFKGKEKKFIIQSEVLLDNVRNILFNSDKDDNFRLTLTFMENEFSISSPTCVNEGLPLEAGRTSLQIDFNAYLLEGIVKNMGSKLFIFSYSDRHSPVVFEPYDSNIDLVSVVAPLK